MAILNVDKEKQMLTNFIGTYTIDAAKSLVETHMRNQLIVSFESTFIAILVIAVVAYLIYSVSKCCMEDIVRNGRGSRGW